MINCERKNRDVVHINYVAIEFIKCEFLVCFFPFSFRCVSTFGLNMPSHTGPVEWSWVNSLLQKERCLFSVVVACMLLSPLSFT